MDRRIYGVETEYGITCASNIGEEPPLEAEAAARELFAPLVRQGKSTNLFLANGGRLYLDVGAHPEYATAECDNLWDLLAQDRAGTNLLAGLTNRANQSLRDQQVPGTIHLFRNNLDSAGNSFGCHENYLLRRRRDFREVADALVTFFVTRQILVGAGAVKELSPGQYNYCFSARSDQMWDAVSAATTRARPIINTRDEPLADAGSYRRMHVIVGDSNMAEPTTALKVGSVELLLDAIDRGVGLDDLALEDPLAAIKEINSDLDAKLLLPMKNGSSMRAVDVQQIILERVLSVLNLEELSEIQRYVVDLWQRTIEAIRSTNWDSINTEIDFAIKRQLLDSYIARTGYDLGDSRVSRLLLSYHDIAAQGLRNKLERAKLMLRLTNQGRVDEAESAAPRTTRAHLRGRVIRAAEEHRRDLNVDWVHLRLEGEQQRAVALQNPFETESRQVDEMVELIVASAPILPA